jgi:hypothetical protein
MTVTVADIRHELGTNFALACERLAEARLRQEEKDTPNNRAAVRARRTRIDTVLDLYLDLGDAALWR